MAIVDLSQTQRAPATARKMAQAARAFLAALNEAQRERAHYPFDDDARFVWHWIPFESCPRSGLRLIQMSDQQQARAQDLLASALSPSGHETVNQIRDLDITLRSSERVSPDRAGFFVRDPELYYFAVFGEPGGNEPWGWSASGHHVSLNFAVVDGEYVSATPLFFGANPAEVRHATPNGHPVGHRTLAEEEDRGRDLLLSLDPAQRATAVVKDEAPRELLNEPTRRPDRDSVPVGLSYSAMGGEQREKLVGLVQLYMRRTNDELYQNQWRVAEQAGLDGLTFSWMGGDQPGQGHYYAVKGPTLLIEYDNVQDGANHQHTVLRDFTNDFGADLLAEHYHTSHGQ